MDPKRSPTHPERCRFAGVPFVIKELVLHAKNVRLDSGCRLAQGTVPDADTELMDKLSAWLES